MILESETPGVERPEVGVGDVLNEEIFVYLLDNPNEVERERDRQEYYLAAKKAGKGKSFNDLYKAYANENKKVNAYLPAEPSPNRLDLEMNSRGGYVASINNFVKILEEDEEYKGNIRLNELSKVAEFCGDPWNDTTDSKIRLYIESKYKIHSKEKLNDAIRVVYMKNSYNPIKEKIESVCWDGVSRIKTMLTKWLLADNTEYVQEISRLIFAGGIHRLYDPGCKFDDMAVLVGTNQGEGKSTYVRLLAMDDTYFVEVKDIEGQKGVEVLQGAWICEMGELLALTKAKEVEAVKAYITCRSDKYRKPYERHTEDVKRTSIFIGTTNNPNFLIDKTGNRRFYPVETKSRAAHLFDNLDELNHDIEQCWAEALHLYKQNAIPPYMDRAIQNEATKHQEEAMYDDYRVGLIEDFLDHRTITCILQIWHEALNNPIERKPQKKDSLEIGQIVRKIPGWESSNERRTVGGYGRQRVFIKMPF